MQDVLTRRSLSTAEYLTLYSSVDKDLRVETSCITLWIIATYVCCSGKILLTIYSACEKDSQAKDAQDSQCHITSAAGGETFVEECLYACKLRFVDDWTT